MSDKVRLEDFNDPVVVRMEELIETVNKSRTNSRMILHGLPDHVLDLFIRFLESWNEPDEN